MKAFIVVLMLVAGAFAASDNDPDGTNEKLHLTTCSTTNALVLNAVAITNTDGSSDYPINVDAALHLALNFTNTGSTALDKITVDAAVARYTDIFGICSWIGIPTFGLTNNLDACTWGSKNICPVPPGATETPSEDADLSGFQQIINLVSASEPYRLTLTFKANGGKQVACFAAEAKIRKG